MLSRRWLSLGLAILALPVGMAALGGAGSVRGERPVRHLTLLSERRAPGDRRGSVGARPVATGAPGAQEVAAPSPGHYEIPHVLGAGNLATMRHRLPLAPRPFGRRRVRGGSFTRSSEAAAAAVDTLRVLALRISFLEDRSGTLTSVTTNGDFDLRRGVQNVYDPPPHNRAYFLSQMEALRRFYWHESGGKLYIEYEVAPSDSNESYRLSDLADYGPGSYGGFDPANNEENWEKLVRDAFAAADAGMASEPYSLSDFDLHILFHAGADLQGDVRRNSPNDLPSFTVFFPDTAGVPIDAGADSIHVAMLVPETVSQDGFQGGLMGTVCHEFGHLAFGLADLYNTYYGWPEVGLWALMDSGNLVSIDAGFGPADGLVAPSLCMVHKVFLGWVQPRVVSSFEEGLEVLASMSPSAGEKAVLLDVSPTEYFLIENRQGEVDGLPTFLKADSTGVVLGPVNCLNCPPGPDEDFDLVASPEYDVGLPSYGPDGEVGSGPGLLIWHVDELRYFGRLFSNQVQVGGRAVALEEASGVEDLGDPTSPLIFGWPDDPFFAGNNDRFADHTLPASWANSGAFTHFAVEKISGLDTVMTFDAGNPYVVEGWPRELGAGGAFGTLSLGITRFAGEGDARLCLWDSAGRLDVYGPGGDPENPGLIDLGGEIVFPPSYTDRFLTGPDLPGIAVAERGGTVHVFEADRGGGPPAEFPGWPKTLPNGAGVRNHLVLVEGASGTSVIVTDDADRVHRYSSGGSVPLGKFPVALDSLRTPPALVDVEGDGALEVAIVAGTRLHVLDGTGNEPSGFPVALPFNSRDLDAPLHLLAGDVDAGADGAEEVWVVSEAGSALLVRGDGSPAFPEPITLEGPVSAAPLLVDVNGDRDLELVYATPEVLGTRTRNGATARGWPRHWSRVRPLEKPGVPISPLTAGSLDGLVGPELLVGTDDGTVYLMGGGGEGLEDWPVLLDIEVGGALLPADLDADGRTEIYTVSRFGRVSAWELPASAASGTGSRWSRPFADGARTSRAVPAGAYRPVALSEDRLESDVILYPNPARGDFLRMHYTAIPNSEVEVSIFNLEGEEVFHERRRHGGSAGGSAELEWRCGGAASGVYLCRFQVQSGGRTLSTVKKLAVMR
jgi:M6 family metalloprotease-like protein